MARITTSTEATATHNLTRPKQIAEHFQIRFMALYRCRKQEQFPRPLKRRAAFLYNCPPVRARLDEES